MRNVAEAAVEGDFGDGAVCCEELLHGEINAVIDYCVEECLVGHPFEIFAKSIGRHIYDRRNFIKHNVIPEIINNVT